MTQKFEMCQKMMPNHEVDDIVLLRKQANINSLTKLDFPGLLGVEISKIFQVFRRVTPIRSSHLYRICTKLPCRTSSRKKQQTLNMFSPTR